MTRTSSAGASTPAAILSVAALAVAIAVAFAAAGNRTGSPAPSDGPSSTPVVTPAPSQPAVTPSPTPGLDGTPVPLDTALGHNISVVISDPDGLLVDGTSGRGADGMSVRWGSAIVDNLDPNTIVVTWAGYPRDEVVGLLVTGDGDGVHLRFGQDAPYPNTDAMGADRVLVLTFDQPVAAGQVDVEFATDGD